MNRLLLHLIVVGSLSLAFVGVQQRTGRSIVALDFFGIAFALYGAIQIGRGRWKLDLIAGSYLVFVGTLTLAAFLNDTVLRGEFLNVARTHILGVTYYLYARYSLTTARDYDRLLIAIMICGAIYLPLSLHELDRIWGEGFKHYETMFGPLMNLNGWGFTWLLIFAAGLLGWSTSSSKKIKIGCAVMSVVCVGLVPLSFSRSAFIGLAAFAMIFAFISFPRYRIAAFLLGVGSVLLFNAIVALMGRGFDDSVIDFWAAKQNNMADEIITVRLQELTLNPMIEAAQKGMGSVIAGVGISTDHSIISHTFVSAGLLGLVALLVYHFVVFSQAGMLYRSASPSLQPVARRAFGALVALTIVVLADDVAVNLRSYLPPVCLFYNLTLGMAMSCLSACSSSNVNLAGNPHTSTHVRRSAAHLHRRISTR